MSKIDELLRLSICLKRTFLCVFDRLETKVHVLDAMDVLLHVVLNLIYALKKKQLLSL